MAKNIKKTDMKRIFRGADYLSAPQELTLSLKNTRIFKDKNFQGQFIAHGKDITMIIVGPRPCDEKTTQQILSAVKLRGYIIASKVDAKDKKRKMHLVHLSKSNALNIIKDKSNEILEFD